MAQRPPLGRLLKFIGANAHQFEQLPYFLRHNAIGLSLANLLKLNDHGERKTNT